MLVQEEWLRYVQHRVMVTTYGHKVVWGKLESVTEEYLRLVDTIARDELESGGWFERMQFADEEAGGPRDAETLIPIRAIVSLTAADPIVVADPEPDVKPPAPESDDPSPSSVTSIDADPTPVDPILVEIGAGLLDLFRLEKESPLVKAIILCRQQIATDFGVVIPPVRIRDNRANDPNEYRILINGHVAASGQIYPDRVLALRKSHDPTADDADETLDKTLNGILVHEPTFGLNSHWIEPSKKSDAESLGMMVVDPGVVLVTHLSEILRVRLHEILTYQHVLELISSLKRSGPDAVADLFPTSLVLRYHRILQGLLREGVPVKSLNAIVHSVAFHVTQDDSEDELLRRVRIDIGRDVCSPFLTEDGKMPVIELAAEREHLIYRAIQQGNDLDELPAVTSLMWSIDTTTTRRPSPVLMVRRSELRAPLVKALARQGERIPVIARDEIPDDVRLSVLGKTQQERPIKT